MLAGLERPFGAAGRFRFRLDRTGWSGTDVLWPAPADPGPFRALTRRAVEASPGFPPYEGRSGDTRGGPALRSPT
ncbi:MAG TPA: hypothetical protein VKV38_09335 [Trebonia sp.]|nr:hypothetical protein [Trebonia sp.]